MAIHDIASYTPEENAKYFIDCNVLMYVFYTNGSYAADLVSDYSQLISQIIDAGATIYVTEMLVSEFTNTYIQCEFHRLARLNGWPRNKTYFKNTFKLTQEYADILKEIKIIINRQLLPFATKINTDFEKFDTEAIYDKPQTFDFNDRYYGVEMKRLGSFIITNDADFSEATGCEIITKNQDLLSVTA